MGKSRMAFKKVKGITIVKLSGGRPTEVIKSKRGYNRKDKKWKKPDDNE